jgi:hypothetical protein
MPKKFKSFRERKLDLTFSIFKKAIESNYYNNGHILLDSNPSFKHDLKLLDEFKQIIETVDALGGIERIKSLVSIPEDVKAEAGFQFER